MGSASGGPVPTRSERNPATNVTSQARKWCGDGTGSTGHTAARIPWPVGRRKGSPGQGPVLYGDQAEAVRRESNQAVCHRFGVTAQTVTKWRKALGVGATNPGTHRLRSDYTAEPWAEAARQQAHARLGDPARRAKIAAAMRGRPRPNTGWDTSGPRWTAEHDAPVRTVPPQEAARRIGRTRQT